MPQTPLSQLGLNYDHDAGTDGWKASYDANLVILDIMANGSVIDERAAQPGGAALGDAYIIANSGVTGASWVGNERAVAIWNASASAWVILAPVEGWQVYDRGLARMRVFESGEWTVRDSIVTVAANVTIDHTHYGAAIELDTTAAARDITIPTDASQNLPIGFHFYAINNSGSNNVTFTLAGLTTRGIAAIAADRGVLRIVKVAADTWISS